MIWPARSAQEQREIERRREAEDEPPKRRNALVRLHAGPIVKRPDVEIDVCPVPTGEGGAW